MLDADGYDRLAAEYGTPLYVYDGEVLAGALDRLHRALPDGMEVFYSLKANPNLGVCALLAAHGARAEVSSLVELMTAVRAGVAPDDIVFLGPGKSPAELTACVATGIWAVVVESFQELDELDRVAAAANTRQRVLLRVNPSTSAGRSGLTMGGKPRQFGIDEKALLEAGPLGDRHPHLELAGIHAYLGTRILDAGTVVANTALVLDMAERIAKATGIGLEAVDVGGGLGVAYFDGEADPDLDALREGMAGAVAPFRARHPGTRLLFETGRFLAALAGTYVVRVRYVKDSMGKRFAVTDGGTHHHMAAVGLGSYVKRNFPVRLLSRPGAPADGPWQLTGPLCTPHDLIAKDVPLPDPAPGDLVGIERSGAYGPTASPGLFLSHGFPAEVLVHEGTAHLVRVRDEPADLLDRQRLPLPFEKERPWSRQRPSTRSPSS
ncbi:type III PLP-dependent enzyme [Actinomadura rubrisoli]|uniref:Type III PLP-dependent enzyme n=2 Tax=Actinomadura rubrisoli TaxID=2530368 RepID=A0A4V2YYX5_9ACTN|nr:type III PLP-dependent enzyme [Actinomadura rubrisoli]